MNRNSLFNNIFGKTKGTDQSQMNFKFLTNQR